MPGSREITLAIERNEVHGACGFGWTGIDVDPPRMVRQKIRSACWCSSASTARRLEQARRAARRDFARTDDDRQVIELVFSQGVFGRPYVLPPGVPADRVAALRKAFVAALNDKTLREDAAKMQFDVDPMAGDELQTLVASIYATPPYLIERARQALTVKPSAAKPSSDKASSDKPSAAKPQQ